MITPDKREKFKDLYFRKYNILLTDEQATEAFTDLINLVRVITKSRPKKIEVIYPKQHETIEF